MNPDAKPETILWILAAILAINTVVGAFTLRASVWLCNKLLGTPKTPVAVPEPSFGHAALIVFFSTLGNLLCGFVLGAVMLGSPARGGNASAASLPMNNPAFHITCIAISFLVLAGLSTAMLPTTFPRGLIVSLNYLLVTFFLVYGGYLIAMSVMGK